MAPSTSASNKPGSSTAAADTTPAGPTEELSTIDRVVQFLLSTEKPAAVIQTELNALRRDALLTNTLENGQDPLAVLDPERHTLGYLYILSARLTPGAPPPQTQQVEAFCKKFNPQEARLAPNRITALAKGIKRASADNLKHALIPLRDLVMRYPPNLSYLTNIHPMFLDACVTTRHFTAALPVLSVPILNIDTSISDLHYNDSLVYHYAGGVVFGALKRWREAEEFFEIVVTSPAQTPAAIQLEAFKKLTLVQLILYGKALPAPKYAHNTVTRLLKSSPYGNLTKHYPQTVPSLTALIVKDVDTFRADQNFGLVQQVVDRAPRWLIKKLTLTFITLGLSDIARQVALDKEEVRSVVLSMVEDGEINASISVDDTITFADSTPQFSKADVDGALLQAQEQAKLLHDIERALNTSKEYLHKALKHKDESWGMDEDIMFGNPRGGSGAGWDDEPMYA